MICICWRQDSFWTINHFCKMWQVVFHLDSLFPFPFSLPFWRPTHHFINLSITSTVQQGINFGCTGIPCTLFLNSKAEGWRGDYLSSEELSIARKTYLTETVVSAERKSQLRLGMLQLHTEIAQSQQPTSRPQRVRWKENPSVSEESVQRLLLFRAIKLPRSKYLLNRHGGFKSTKMLYTFFSFHLIYLLWVFWI